MGLLSRLGNQFATDMPMRSMGQDALKGMSYGTVGGALAGAVDGPEGLHPGIGMMGGAAAGTALGAAGGLRHVVMTIARALKQQHPQVPDEAILKKAQELAALNHQNRVNGVMPDAPGQPAPPGDPGAAQFMNRFMGYD